jgi:hypothetical protein
MREGVHFPNHTACSDASVALFVLWLLLGKDLYHIFAMKILLFCHLFSWEGPIPVHPSVTVPISKGISQHCATTEEYPRQLTF